MTDHWTIWVCQCCMLTACNGSCCDSTDHGGDGRQPWSREIGTAGMVAAEHAEDCLTYLTGGNAGAIDGDYQCDCEEDQFSRAPCDGCGSELYGSRYAFTAWADPAPCRGEG